MRRVLNFYYIVRYKNDGLLEQGHLGTTGFRLNKIEYPCPKCTMLNISAFSLVIHEKFCKDFCYI